jgi:hypothetical protein
MFPWNMIRSRSTKICTLYASCTTFGCIFASSIGQSWALEILDIGVCAGGLHIRCPLVGLGYGFAPCSYGSCTLYVVY